VSGDSAGETRIDGAPITQVTLVGQIRALTPQQTVITIRLDDGTGVVDVKKYIDPDKQDEAVAGLELDMHVRVWGKLNPFGGKQFVQALVVRPVESYDEVNCHMLEASYVHLYMTRGPPGGGGDAGAGSGAAAAGHDGSGGDSMFVDGGAGTDFGAGAIDRDRRIKLNSCSAGAKRIYNFLQKEGTNEGLHLQLIANGAGLSVRDVVTSADELLEQGLIYTTIDDETWAILDY